MPVDYPGTIAISVQRAVSLFLTNGVILRQRIKFQLKMRRPGAMAVHDTCISIN